MADKTAFIYELASDAELALHEAIRRSHCDHRYNDDPHHKCLGVTVISSEGVRLSCTLCGTGRIEDRVVTERAETRRHLNVLTSAVSRHLILLLDLTAQMNVPRHFMVKEEEP